MRTMLASSTGFMGLQPWTVTSKYCRPSGFSRKGENRADSNRLITNRANRNQQIDKSKRNFFSSLSRCAFLVLSVKRSRLSLTVD